MLPPSVRPFQWVELEEPPKQKATAPAVAEPAPARPGPELVLAQARAEAEGIVAQAQTDAEQIREAARREGLELGKREGLALAEQAADRWARLAEELGGHKARLYEDARSQVVELVLGLAAKILGPLAESDAEAVVRVTGRALQAVSERETLTIRVHPEDLQGLLDAKPRLLQSFDGIKKLTILEDPSVGRGGCLVETPTAEIDARLDSQFREIARALRKT